MAFTTMVKPWLVGLKESLERSEPCMVVTLVEVRGSAPQVNGAKIIISPSAQWGTIGGGNLEYQAVSKVRSLLEQDAAVLPQSWVEHVSLGVSLGQCCGGAATLVYQHYDVSALQFLGLYSEASTDKIYLLSPLEAASPVPVFMDHNELSLYGVITDDVPALDEFIRNPELAAVMLQLDDGSYLLEKLREDLVSLLLFGAGHVGSAVVKALKPLPFLVRWIDNREALPIGHSGGNVTTRFGANSLDEVNQAMPGSWALVMTHDHSLDFAILRAVLKREDFGHIGLIGSKTKLKKFQHSLRDLGFSQSAIKRINCPIGIEGISSKQPAVIAASLVAQLLLLREKKFGFDGR